MQARSHVPPALAERNGTYDPRCAGTSRSARSPRRGASSPCSSPRSTSAAEALAFWRLALAAATLALVALRRRAASTCSPREAVLARSSCSASLQGAHWLLFFEAVKHGSVALAVLTFYAAPLLLAVVAPLVLRERCEPRRARRRLVGAVGIAADRDCDGDGGSASAWAVAAGLGSAATYAALVVLSKRLLLAATPPAHDRVLGLPGRRRRRRAAPARRRSCGAGRAG